MATWTIAADSMSYERWESRDHYQKYLAWRTETGVLNALGAKSPGHQRSAIMSESTRKRRAHGTERDEPLRLLS